MRIDFKRDRAKLIVTALMVLATAIFWIVPSNVARLVALHRDVLLGRYSVDRLAGLFLAVPIGGLALYIIWAKKDQRRIRKLRVTARAVSVLVSFTAVDLVIRLTRPARYVLREGYQHRVPNTTVEVTHEDIPRTVFSFPVVRPGHPDVKCTLTTDKRGFRNLTDLDRYDVIVLGDSFVEGSSVSDRQVWPALLAAKSKWTVCNLGMSGGHPGNYLATLKL